MVRLSLRNGRVTVMTIFDERGRDFYDDQDFHLQIEQRRVW